MPDQHSPTQGTIMTSTSGVSEARRVALRSCLEPLLPVFGILALLAAFPSLSKRRD